MANIWDNEPDYLEFKHADLLCVIKRMPLSGHLCGYVGVTKEHRYFKKSYRSIDDHIYCLGGLTFAGKVTNEKKEEHPNIHFFGFACDHLDDIAPKRANSYNSDATYKDIDFVTQECIDLAEQLNYYKMD